MAVTQGLVCRVVARVAVWFVGWSGVRHISRGVAGPRLVAGYGRLPAWPGWARLSAAARAVVRAAVGWSACWPPILARYAAGWVRQVGRGLVWLAVRSGRWARSGARAAWLFAEPYARDVAGWLLHRSWRKLGLWAGRMLLRFLRWAPPATAHTVWWALVGLGFVLRHVARYCVGYADFGGIVAEAIESDRPRREYTYRQRWRRAALRRTGSILAVVVLLAVAGWWLIHRYGRLAELVLTVAGVAVFAGIGRAVRPPAPSPERPVAAPPGDPDAPYPLADARTRAEAADCLTRALSAENIELRRTEDARRTEWGWEVPVILRKGTPAAVVGKAGELETHLDLPAGGVLATPDRARRARVMMRLAQIDPFLTLPDIATRPPRSATITGRASIGARIDGAPLAVPLLGVHGVVIGSPGAGKSSTLLTLADAVSVCSDAVVWDLDPAGDGLRALGDGVGRRERDRAGIETALADAVALAETRPRMLADLGMRGGAWEPSPERPAVVVFVDEYPRLTTKAKELAVTLLRIGRKARVTVILAATEATSDALGAAIADTTALKIMHACRHGDVQLVLGPQMLAEGWRPDRLHPATADDPGDVGRCYVSTAGAREPLLSKVAPVDPDDAALWGAQRATAGLPHIDADSWQRAHALRTADPDAGQDVPGVDRTVLDHVIEVFGGDRRLWTDRVLTRLAALDDRYDGWTADDLAAALRPAGVVPVQIKRDGINRRGYDRASLIDARDSQ